jgi:hypothetical protein
MKTCISCKKELDESEFSFKSRAKGTLQSRCKSCYNEYNRGYYQSGERTKQLERVKNNNKQLRVQFQEWKKQQSCSCCGEDATECLDLHHLDPTQKEGTLARINDFGSWNRILEEIAKCIVVCANCHRKIHTGRIILPR